MCAKRRVPKLAQHNYTFKKRFGLRRYNRKRFLTCRAAKPRRIRANADVGASGSPGGSSSPLSGAPPVLPWGMHVGSSLIASRFSVNWLLGKYELAPASGVSKDASTSIGASLSSLTTAAAPVVARRSGYLISVTTV